MHSKGRATVEDEEACATKNNYHEQIQMLKTKQEEAEKNPEQEFDLGA